MLTLDRYRAVYFHLQPASRDPLPSPPSGREAVVERHAYRSCDLFSGAHESRAVRLLRSANQGGARA